MLDERLVPALTPVGVELGTCLPSLATAVPRLAKLLFEVVPLPLPPTETPEPWFALGIEGGMVAKEEEARTAAAFNVLEEGGAGAVLRGFD